MHAPYVSSHLWFLASVPAALAAIVLRGWACTVVLAIACALAAGGWLTLRIHEIPGDSIARALSPTPVLITVEGSVRTAPRSTTAPTGRLAPFARFTQRITRFELAVDHIIPPDGPPIPVSGALWVRLTGDPPAGIAPGRRVRIAGLARSVRAPMNPGETDGRRWATARGIAGSLAVSNAGVITPARTPAPWSARVANPIRDAIGVAQRRASAWLEPRDDRDNPTEAWGAARPLVAALVLGQRDPDLRPVSEAFSHTGLAHLLALSGLHLGILAWCIVMVVRMSGDHRLAEPLILITALLVFIAIVPARAPILRATIMVAAFVLADLAGRRYDRLNTLAWAYIAVLLIRPMELWAVGFQLSFLVVAGLIACARPLRERLFRERDVITPDPDHMTWRDRVAGFGKDAVSASLCAWGVGTPLVAYHIGIITPLGVPATLVAMPLTALVLILGFCTAVVSAVSPVVAAAVSGPVLASADALAWVAFAIDRIPGVVVFVPSVSVAWAAAATAVIAWWMVRGTWRSIPGVVITAVVIGWFAWDVLATRQPPSVAVRIDALAVGDGSCYLLRSGGEAVLFDCGSTWLAVGERAIPRAVRALGSPPVRTAIITHPDLDHYAGLLDAAPPLGVRTVLTTEAMATEAAEDPAGSTAHVLGELDRMGIAVRTIAAGDTVLMGDVVMRVVWPPPGAQPAKDNDGSVVLVVPTPVSADGRSGVLLVGDIEKAGMAGVEAALDGGSGGMRPIAMEAPHHGSARPFAYPFVAGLDPGIVIQSTSERRVGDERWDDVKRGRTWLTTAVDGAVTVIVRRDGGVDVSSLR